MKEKRRWNAGMAISALMTAVMLAGCSSNGGNNENSATNTSTSTATNSAATTTADNGPDISKKVELNWYLVGGSDPNTDKVMSEVNKMLEKDINATIKLNFTTWTDWQTKYNLLLTSGEAIDMIFASSWADYFKFAKEGAFLDLTDLLPKAAPKTWSAVPKQDWNDVTVDGKIYAVPSTFGEYTPDGWVYREDWRQKFNLPEITDLASLEAYMDGIKKNMPNVTPIGGGVSNEIKALYRAYYDFQPIGGQESLVGASSYDNPRDIVTYPFTQDFSDFVHKTKEWADKGYWSKNALSSKQNADNMIKSGTSAIKWTNPAGASTFIAGVDKDTSGAIKLEYFPFTRFHNYAVPNLAINNGMAIPKSAKNADRSLMALDLIRNDPKYFNLMTYGIEGYNYSMADDGKHIVTPAKGQDPDKVKGYNIASWGWQNEAITLFQEGGWDKYDKLKEEFKAETKPNIFAPITMDFEQVKSELAAVNQVVKQYGGPLFLGLVPDVDKALQTYRDKLKQAGVEKLADYVKKQSYAYYDAKGIK